MEYYSGSEWSSGCESGWTSYFEESSYLSPNDQSHRSTSNSNNYVHKSCKKVRNSIHHDRNNREEEDLSMVSDASSGPPTHLHDCFDPIPIGYPCLASGMKRKKNNKNGSDQKIRGKIINHKENGYLDDTATSPGLKHSKRYLAAPIHQESILDYDRAFHSSRNIQVLSDQFQGRYSLLNNPLGYCKSNRSKKCDSAEPNQMRGKR